MAIFLEQIIQKLQHLPPDTWQKQAFVFPNRRSSIFFKNQLTAQIHQATYLPAIFTWETFLTELTGLSLLDETNLLFELYPVYHNYFPEDSLDIFWNWGKTMLQDFNEIDTYNQNVEEILSNLEALREIDIQIESWEAEDRESYKNRFVWFWKSIKPIYKQFRKVLFSKKLAYKGLALKNALYDIQKIQNQPFEKIYFCGFHGFTPGEEAFIQALGTCAEVIFDIDEWYLNPVHVAGKWLQKSTFIHSNSAKISQLKEKKDIYIIGTPQKQAQIKAIDSLWKTFDLKEEKTVVILPEPSLLFPFLYAIPESVRQVNITLGYPLAYSAIYGFLQTILAVTVESSDKWLHTPDVLALIRHPYCTYFEPETLNYASQLSQKHPGKIHYTQLLAELPSTLHPLFRLYAPADGINHFKEILLHLRKNIRENPFSALEEEFLLAAYLLLNRLQDIALCHSLTWNINEFSLVFSEIAHTHTIPFSGEPVLGLQCMGFLETRGLDFETVIIPGMNSGTVPPDSSANTLIPFEIRKRYGLALPEDKEAEHSYYFYRLIQRAKQVFLLYDSEEIPSEKSPLIAQLEAEWKPLHPENWHEYNWVPEIRTIQNKQIIIEKTQTWEAIVQMAKSGFSATKIQSYLQCPVKFGFQLLGYQAVDDKENNLDDADFGVLFHSAAEELYTVLQNYPEIHTLSEKDVIALARRKYNIPEKNFWQKFIQRSFAQHFENRVLEGKNILACQVIEAQLQKLLQRDLYIAKNKPFKILSLEKKWATSLQLKKGLIENVRCKGFIDRVDEDEHCIRAIDYKTGNIQSLSYPDTEVLFSNQSPKEAFQLMFYAWLLYKNKKTPPIQAVIYQVRRHEYAYLKKDGAIFSIYPTDMQSFESNLRKVIEEITDLSKPLTQTENEKNCQHCIYKDVCLK